MLLCLAGVFSLPVPAFAGAIGITIGFVPSQGIIRNADTAEAFANLLSARLNRPVKVRLFDSEAGLHQWLSRYLEVDLGWLGEASSRQANTGDVLPVAIAERLAGGTSPGYFAVRQGLDAPLLQQIRDALLGFGQRPEERSLLTTLALARFVDVTIADEETVLFHPAENMASAAAQAPVEPVEIIFHADEPSPVPAAPGPRKPAETPKPQAPPVLLSADRLDYDNDNKVIQAGGDVTLQQGETTLAADELLWQETTRDAAASGNVRLAEPGAEMAGSSLYANLATGKGLARDSRVFFRERNFHLAGDEIERFGESTYRVTGGRFTTCDGEIPDWQFSADRVDVSLGRFATARNVWFEIHNQPVFYLPYLLFPVKAERESGFLLPRAGFSSRKGTMLSLAWYQVIDRNLDATLYLDTLSKVGIGKGLEYRYVLDNDNVGQALLYHVTGLSQHDDTFALKWRHDGNLPGGVKLTANVDYVEDIEYFEDFGNAAEEYTRDHAVSSIMLQRNWDHLNLTVLNEYIRDLEDGNEVTLQRLPEVNLSLLLHRLGDSWFYLRAENSLTNFVRKEGVDGLRDYFNPELMAAFKPGSWLELTPKVAAHGRYYRIDSIDGSLHRDDYDDESLVAEYALTASTRLARVFPLARWGIEKLKHSIEPQITYTYIPDANQEKLPFFDVYDQIGPSNRVEYALVNRLTGRAVDGDGNPSYRELLNLRLSQGYDIAVARDDHLPDQEPFSDLRIELQANPTVESFINLDALLPVYGDQRFSKVTTTAGYSSRRGNTLALDYAYVRDDYGIEPSDYLGLKVGTTMLAPVYADFRERYDFRDGRSLERLLNLEYRARCWSLFLSLRNRSAENDGPDNNEIMAGFALSGIGRVGGFGSKLSSTPSELDAGTAPQ
jgi:LPS-assembly protein